MKFECTNCTQRLEIRAVYAGKEIECPTCKKMIIIPEPGRPQENVLPDEGPKAPVAPKAPVPPSASAKGSGDKARALLPGESRGKRYTLQGELARGGMGSVDLAEDANLGRPVALKRLLEPSTATATDIARFIGEAQITGQLEHPSIVPVHELGIDADGEIFYTMKRITGITLTDVLDGFLMSDAPILERWTLPRLLRAFQRVCDAVSFAHSRGVIHRDLKPENIMVGEFGEVVLLDWGIAKVLDGGAVEKEADSSPSHKEDDQSKSGTAATFHVVPVRTGEGINLMTLAGDIMGTPMYMPPEQVESCESVDERADVFSLGAILYEILALAPPYREATVMALLERARKAEWEPLDTIEKKAIRKKSSWPHLPGGRMPIAVAAVAMKAIAKDPGDRYQTVEEMQADIDAYLNGFATEAENAGLGRLLWLFLSRHKLAALFSVALLSVLLAGLVINMRERRIAEVNEKRAVEAEQLALKRLGEVEEARSVAQRERTTAEEARNAAKNRLIRQLINRGANHLSSDDMAGSLPWFVSALEVEKDPLKGKAHRVRLGTVLRASSTPIILGFHDGAVNAIVFDRSGNILVTAGEDGMLRSWNAKEKVLIAEQKQPDALVDLKLNQLGDRLISICANGTAQVWQTDPLLPVGTPIKPVGSRSSITHAAFSPDGLQIAISSGNRYKTPGMREMYIPGVPRTMQVPSGSIRLQGGVTIPRMQTITIPGTPQRISIADNPRGQTRLWDIEKMEYAKVGLSIRGWTNHAAFSPDGSWLATAGGAQYGSRQVKILDLKTNEERFDAIKPRQDIQHVEISPKGDLLVTGSGDETVRVGGEAQLWDTQTGKKIGNPMQHSDLVTQVTFSPSGNRLLTASWDGTVRVWDNKGNPLFSPLLHKDRVTAAAFSPAGEKILTASRDHTVRIWQGETGSPAMPQMQHESPVLCADWDPNGIWVASGTDTGIVRIWDTSEKLNQPLQTVDQSGQTLFAGYSPDGEIFFTLNGGRMEMVISGSAQSVKKAGISLSKISAWSSENNTLIWEGELGNQTAELHTATVKARLPMISPDGKFLTISTPESSPEKLRMWELKTGEPVALGEKAQQRCWWLGKNPKQTLALVSGEETQLHLQSLPGGSQVGHPISLPKDASILLATVNLEADRLAVIVSIPAEKGRGKPTFKLLVYPYLVDGQNPEVLDPNCPKLDWIEMMPNGAVLGIPAGKLFGNDLDKPGQLVWWIAGQAPLVESAHRGGITHVGMSPNQKFVVTCGRDRTARVWDQQSGHQALPSLVHRDAVTFASFSPDNRFIGTGAGRVAQVWDASTGEPVTPLFRHSGIVTAVKFHPSGTALISSTLSGKVYIWDLSPDSRPLDEIRDEAKFRSAHWLDSLGGYTPLSIDSLRKLK